MICNSFTHFELAQSFICLIELFRVALERRSGDPGESSARISFSGRLEE
jgi:hypothetical protein